MYTRHFLLAVSITLTILLITLNARGQSQQSLDSLWRPQVHFSAARNWLNDPNGMVYHQGTYHLFFQHHPNSPQWGPMHWGHATSRDLVHWQEQPIKLFPDSLGYIFSGSAVLDKDNTSGLGKKDNPPLVAIFTHHDPAKEKTTNTFQVQSLAFSLDSGRTWTKYRGNPVLKNPGITDFRDPKVTWYEPRKCWIMTLATKDCVTFYASPNLVDWTRESSFGKDRGAHGGVWECPDLFPLQYGGKTTWVLLVSINPGGPNGGSATQYFLGDFDGRQFTANHEDIRWVDYGPDDYAGVTWSNTGDRKLFMGWMSNWDYANALPSMQWRNAMTIARELRLEKSGDTLRLASVPVPELASSRNEGTMLRDKTISAGKAERIVVNAGTKAWQCEIETESAADFHVRLLNDLGEELIVGFDSRKNQYYIDRGLSGQVSPMKDFARNMRAPRFSKNKSLKMTLLVDAGSLEIFADDGLTVMTTLFFPREPMTKAMVASPGMLKVKTIRWWTLKP